MSSITPELRKHLEERKQRERQLSTASKADSDTLLTALEKAGPFFDEGWSRKGLRPSSMAVIRYCQLMTAPDPDAPAEAERLARSWLTKARQRYRDGFYANPFGDPMRRAGA